MTSLFAGIDGGQSSTVAVVADESGRILGCGTAGPADEIGVGKGSTRLRDALCDALENASRSAHLAQECTFAAIVAGISGYDGQVYGAAPKLPSARVTLMHDTPIAHVGALGGRPGVVAIAGTGSVVYGRNEEGWSCTLGGWGFLFGDEGSALRIACDALRLLMRAHDDGDNSLETETRAACEFFGTDSLRRLAHAYYKGEVTRDQLASFAPTALRYDSLRLPAERSVDRLAALVGMAIEAGSPPRVALVGGVFADAGLRDRMRGAILRDTPGADIVEARYEPVYGALLLAYRELALPVTELQR